MSLINLAQIKDGVSLAERVAALEQLAAKLDAKVFPPPRAEHVVGMVLAEEGGGAGTWVRVNQDFEIVEFDNVLHNTWNNMHIVTNDTYGEFVEIPVTYVKTETLTDGPYAGKNCWWTADSSVEGFHVHPAFIGQDGQPHPLQVASWIASNKNNVPFSEDKGDSRNGYWDSISYNAVHAKGWMTGGCRPYNIYDHHFLARLMLTEFGTPDIKSQMMNGVAWMDDNRTNYHGIHDLFECYWLDGLTMLNSTYQVLAADGSRNMVETGISCPNVSVYPVNCRMDKVNGVDFGDLFIANNANITENLGSFACRQALYLDRACVASWGISNYQGAFCLDNGYSTEYAGDTLGWRVALCS